ncbi:S1 family peptidase [Streptomyces sp. NPDC014894]|uniref:S1 family peptidase n=1 Tax=Streptomyces sp. NPDC014894 TaxID=3364931 RepID=UPI0037008262
MRITRSTPFGGAAVRVRLTAVAAGLLTVSALTAPSAAAEPGGPARATAAQLAEVSDAVLDADIAGTAWYTDRASGAVVVTADRRVSAREAARLERAAAGTRPGVLKIGYTPGTITKLTAGGEAIYGSGTRCSLGFNVRRGNAHYALTAGHCTRGGGTWYTSPSGAVALGAAKGSSFPGDDYGIIRHADRSAAEGRVYLHNGGHRDITSAGTARVGQSVQRSGSTTGLRGGRVTGLDASVNYGGGDVVHGMIQTDACAEAGDSGGPLFAGRTALGLTSGGSGDCARGGVTFFQPVGEALSAHGVKVY